MVLHHLKMPFSPLTKSNINNSFTILLIELQSHLKNKVIDLLFT